MRLLMSLVVFLACLVAALLTPLFEAVERMVVRPIAAALKAPPVSVLLLWRAAIPWTIILMQNTLDRGHRLLHICSSGAQAISTTKRLRNQSLGLPTLGMCNAGLGSMAT